MSCSKKYRERTIEYRQGGHTLEQTHQIFKVSISTIQKWEKQLKEKGNLGKKICIEDSENRSGKIESLCGRASRRIPIRNGAGVWMQRERHS